MYVYIPSVSFKPAPVFTQPPTQWVPGTLFPRVKRPGREADHSPPSSAEVKKIHSSIRLHGVALNYLSRGTTIPLLYCLCDYTQGCWVQHVKTVSWFSSVSPSNVAQVQNERSLLYRSAFLVMPLPRTSRWIDERSRSTFRSPCYSVSTQQSSYCKKRSGNFIIGNPLAYFVCL
jgi:hypothetical protein